MFHSVKSKLLSSRLTKDKEKRLKQGCSAAVRGLQTTLSIAKDVTDLPDVHGLQAGISNLLVAIDAIKVHYISLRLYSLVTFDCPENSPKPGGCRQTRKQDRGIECLSQQREHWDPPAVADRIGRLAR
jgi:hypothetical protein